MDYFMAHLRRHLIGYEVMLCTLVLLFVTTGSGGYVPKSQRNLLSKTFWLLTQPLRDKAYEIVDRYNWAVAKNRNWLFSFPATLIYETVQAPKKEREVVFDTDSETIGVDNRGRMLYGWLTRRTMQLQACKTRNVEAQNRFLDERTLRSTQSIGYPSDAPCTY